MASVDLINRIRKAPTGVSFKQAASKLVAENQATPEDAFLAYIAAELMDKPRCTECGASMSAEDHQKSDICADCFALMFDGCHVPIAYTG